MANTMTINLTGKETNIEKAIINVLNNVSDEMYERRVKQAEIDIATNAENEKQDVLELYSDMVEAVIDEFNSVTEV